MSENKESDYYKCLDENNINKKGDYCLFKYEYNMSSDGTYEKYYNCMEKEGIEIDAGYCVEEMKHI